jgi:GNAT superfamily N-acetyltransferase
MIRGTEPIPLDVEGDVTVEEVDEHTVAECSRVMAEGWAMDVEPTEAFNRLLLAQPDCRQRLFLGRYQGTPAGTACCVVFERSVYLLGGVVLPAFRRRGLYRALVATRLRYAAERGIPYATSHASASTSAPLLERLGFETVCGFQHFSND